MDSDYQAFLVSKAPRPIASGLEPTLLPDHLFDYQKDCVAFAIRQGRAALFLDTGLGKTRCQLEWCKQTAAASNGMALLLTPLAVARQIEREGLELGYEVRVIREQSEAGAGINICNYDRLDKLDPSAFGAVSLDESSILKNFSGATTRALTEAFARHRFRLCATATPAPNDHMELGTHAEFLGQMQSNEMLSRWFVNDTSTGSQVWRLKGHAADAFWDWMATWARCAETPADLGYDASRFVLPEMKVIRHKVAGVIKAKPGDLFAGDLSAANMFDVKRQTSEARASAVAGLVAAEPNENWVIWCDIEAEQNAIVALLPDAIDVRGSHSAEKKEARFATFFEHGGILVSKASVCGMGMNWQHAARMAFVGRSFSYEAWYQAVRRCWRFGQKRDVHIHLAVAEGEEQIGRVIARKSGDHAKMKHAMALAMRRAMKSNAVAPRLTYTPTHQGRLPTWLKSAA